MGEEETLMIRYTNTKEHIEEVKAAAKDYGGPVEEFIHYCIIKYLERHWWPRHIEVPKTLFRELAHRAKELDLTLDDYVDQLLRTEMEKEAGEK